MRLLIDSPIILDFLLHRDPFMRDAEALVDAISSGLIVGYVTASTLSDIFTIALKHTHSTDRAKEAVALVLAMMEICPVNRAALELALTSTNAHLDDAIQNASAITQGLDAIVTRDRTFTNPLIPVLSVAEALDRLDDGA
ncbi:type II toxin-antitoxin system VapC family toxin [Leptolyngbya sp. AN02str]|uniref:type II toxin-antitoxin system VapC family toxin n=1 Tax=Leptolyngbya sp. AN02str TaxID=3423363 RepID=UPI003D3110CD